MRLDAQAELTGEEDIDVRNALLDLDDSDQRAAYIGEVLQVQPERAEASGVLDDEDETPSFTSKTATS